MRSMNRNVCECNRKLWSWSPSLPETEGPFLPLKIDLPKRKGSYSNPSIFRGELLVGRWIVFWGWFRWISLFGARPWKSMVGSHDSLPFSGARPFLRGEVCVSFREWLVNCWSCWTLNPLEENHPSAWLLILPETNSAPLKMGRAAKRHFFLQPSIFRGYVSFVECTPSWILGWARILVKSGGSDDWGNLLLIYMCIGIVFLIIDVHTWVYMICIYIYCR